MTLVMTDLTTPIALSHLRMVMPMKIAWDGIWNITDRATSGASTNPLSLSAARTYAEAATLTSQTSQPKTTNASTVTATNTPPPRLHPGLHFNNRCCPYQATRTSANTHIHRGSN